MTALSSARFPVPVVLRGSEVSVSSLVVVRVCCDDLDNLPSLGEHFPVAHAASGLMSCVIRSRVSFATRGLVSRPWCPYYGKGMYTYFRVA